MDELISRKALQMALSEDTEEGTFAFTVEQTEAADMVIRYIVKTIQSVPSVPAVPIEPLCVWLAGYAAPPQYALEAVTEDPIDPQGVVYTANRLARAWEYHFRELLKSGLMDMDVTANDPHL